MLDDRSTEPRPPTDRLPVPTTFAVQFVLEVENRAFAEQIQDQLPGPETTGVEAERYRSYVDLDGLDYPVVGASIPFYDRTVAVALYEAIPDCDGFEKSVRSGTLAVRARKGEHRSREDPVVVAVTQYP